MCVLHNLSDVYRRPFESVCFRGRSGKEQKDLNGGDPGPSDGDFSHTHSGHSLTCSPALPLFPPTHMLSYPPHHPPLH